MRLTLIILCAATLFSCSSDKVNNSERIEDNTLTNDTTEVFDEIRENFIVAPDLRDLDFIKFDTIYRFSVKNVPGEYIGAQIDRGRISKTSLENFEFFVHPPKDSIEIKIFAQIEGVREYLYVVKKKMK